MAQPRKYDTVADRQRAYRERQALQRENELMLRGWPKAPSFGPVPGKKRWNNLTHTSSICLQTVHDELKEFVSSKSEHWQKSKRADPFKERIAELEEVIAKIRPLYTIYD
jgi:hypothetical protein